ncbi:MAG: transketolase [Thermodesulfobacteriota bacterium]
MPTRKELANAVRALAMDAVQKAKSGHPGAPLGMADFTEVLYNDFVKHNPANPAWPDRDRVVLSNGHASMLLYAVLHLAGYDLSLEDIKDFRQFGSKTPGHPELGQTPGVETTSGPLGQGIACAVGLALAERTLAAQFNRPDFPVVDHHTWALLGDGCLMEGVSHEACSLAGTQKLGKLIALYDDNGISIDGCVDGWFTDDTPARFRAYGWHVIPGVDGHDPEAVQAAIAAAKAETERPSLVCLKTVIGFGAPGVCGTSKCHGSPLGDEQIVCARKQLDWPHPPFSVPADIYAGWDARPRGAAAENAWNDLFAAYAKAHPDLAAQFRRRMAGKLPSGLAATALDLAASLASAGPMATRKASGTCLAALGPGLPELVGGSADLAGSNLTRRPDTRVIEAASPDGDYLNYGVREFAMGCIMNGLSLHGGFIPYGGTFLVFADYMRSAMRMAALMGLRVAYVLTHDSIGVGEDGPTHQPVEHTASLRLIPNLSVWRPADAAETATAWTAAITRQDGPTALVLSRQTLPPQPRDADATEGMARGGYVLAHCAGEPQAILLATGSEVALAMDAAKLLADKGIRVRVVSLPCLDVFAAQPAAYRNAVLPPAVTARVAVEAGSTAGWWRFVGSGGRVVGLDRFGESAPSKALFAHFGFTPEAVAQAVEETLAEQ